MGLRSPVTSQSIRLRHPRGSHFILLSIEVNGRGPFVGVVDTAANRSVISEALVGKARLALRKKAKAETAGGTVSFRLTEPTTIRIGALAIPCSSLVVLDLGALQTKMGTSFDMLIGQDVLKRYRVVIDYPRKQFELSLRNRK